MSGWDNVWDTGQKVNVEIAPGDVRPLDIRGSAVFDTPAYYSGTYSVNLGELFGPDVEDNLELWSRGRDMSQRELQAGITVRDLDGGDVVDRLGMDAALMKWADKTIPFKMLQRMYAKQNDGAQLPAIQRQLGLESVQAKLVRGLVEDANSDHKKALDTAVKLAAAYLQKGARIPDALVIGTQAARKENGVYIGIDELHAALIQHGYVRPSS
jgi:hypothetical protein